MSESILVMGGSYFIGKKIVDTCVERGYSVTVLNRGSISLDGMVTNLKADRDNPEEMKRVLKCRKFDVVMDVSALHRNHIHILLNSLDVTSLRQYVFVSSSAVYDVENLAIPYKETDARARNAYWTDYGTEKIEAENALLEAFSGGGTRLLILRPPYVYGENNYVQRESFIFDHICRGQPVIIPNEGSRKLQFIYADDLANIAVNLLKTEMDRVSIFNVGNRESVTVKEWVVCCAEAAGREVKIIPYPYEKHGRKIRDFFPFYDYDNVLDVSKINQYYAQETDFSEGLKKTYAWFCEYKENIVFKENVAKSEAEILREFETGVQLPAESEGSC